MQTSGLPSFEWFAFADPLSPWRAGKYAARFRKGTNLVVLEPEIARQEASTSR